MKKKKIIFIIIIFTLHFWLVFQLNSVLLNTESKKIESPPSISSTVVNEWNRTWGGSYPSDQCFGVVVDSSDNIFLGGYTNGIVDINMTLVKFDNSGEQLLDCAWGVSNYDEYAHDIGIDASGNIYLSGLSNHNAALVKFNGLGEELWNITYSFPGGWVTVVGDFSDNVYLAATKSYDLILIKSDSSGTQLWNRTWGGSGIDYCYEIAVDSSDNVYITGYTTSYGAGRADVFLVKFSSYGDLEWYSIWGGPDHDYGKGVIVDSSDNIYVAGYTSSFIDGNQDDILLIKYNSSGILQWNRTFGTLNDYKGRGVAVNSKNMVYISGDNEEEFILVEYDSDGVLQGSHIWRGILGGERLNDVTINSIDDVYSAGHYWGDMILFKFIHDDFQPIININSPSPNKRFGDTAPRYDLSIIEPNLKSLWYTIDKWPNIHIYLNSTTQLSDVINQGLWGEIPYGDITITFYALDFNNNFGYSQVIIVKSETVIPGYSILTLVSLMGVTVAIIVVKEKGKAIFN